MRLQSIFNFWLQLMAFNPLIHHEWPREKFSLQYQYNIKQSRVENREKYQLGAH